MLGWVKSLPGIREAAGGSGSACLLCKQPAAEDWILCAFFSAEGLKISVLLCVICIFGRDPWTSRYSAAWLVRLSWTLPGSICPWLCLPGLAFPMLCKSSSLLFIPATLLLLLVCQFLKFSRFPDPGSGKTGCVFPVGSHIQIQAWLAMLTHPSRKHSTHTKTNSINGLILFPSLAGQDRTPLMENKYVFVYTIWISL